MFLVSSFLLPAREAAGDLSAIVEYGYNEAKLRSEDAAGLSSETRTENFSQRYFLTFDRNIYPNLKFLAAGTFDQENANIDTDGFAIKSKSTVLYGLLNLQMNSQMISSGIGYTVRRNSSAANGQSTTPNIFETYTANLRWQPEGLPKLDALFLRTHTFDRDRISQDTIADQFSTTLVYNPIRNLELRGQLTLTDSKDMIGNVDVTTTNYSGHAAYSRRFGDRVMASASYSFSYRETKTLSRGGAGDVLFQVFPFSGLSSLSDTPTLVTLDPNPALIDGNLTAGAGINIGHIPIAGDSRPINAGVDFIVDSEVNTVHVYVDRELPSNVSSAFTWEIYTSEDNLNWTLRQTVPQAAFNVFLNRFEIGFSNVSARFLKVVTRPLPATVIVQPNLQVIFITEMQVFLRRPAAQVEGKTRQSSHLYDVGVRWRILDRPTLYYDSYHWATFIQPGRSAYSFSNALTVSHRFNTVFSGSARLARDDGKESSGTRSSNSYSASLSAVPLRTLSHGLVVSGRFEHSDEGSSSIHSVFLNNTAQLYRGLSFNLSGGLSFSKSVEGRKIKTMAVGSGLSAVPHPTLQLNVSYSESKSRITGGGLEDTTTMGRSGNLSASYSPFETLYLYASVGVSASPGRRTATVQSYSASWSPLRDGDLQFNVSYSETISDDAKDKVFFPSVRWYLRQNATLDLGYSITESESLINGSRRTESNLSSNLRMLLF